MRQPHLAQRIFKISGVLVDVPGWGGLQTFAQTAFEGQQSLTVSRHARSNAHVVGVSFGHPVVQARCAHETGPHARDKIAARFDDHRHTHPQRLQTGGSAVVRHSVQGNVHIGVLGHHVGQSHRATEHQALACDAFGLEALGKRLDGALVLEAGSLEQQARIGHLVQHSRPQLDGVRREFGHVVERAKGQGALGMRLAIVRVGVVGLGRKAKHAVGQAHQPFAEQALTALRRNHLVGDQPVDVGHTSGAGVA